jgi:natural product biosynthesis luciferase-like monooxygenase protein
VRLADAEWVLLWTFHHILMDGRSFPLLLGDAFDVYDALRSGEEPRLPSRRPFREFVAWQRGRSPEGSSAFWGELLAGFRAPTPLPLARPPTNDAPPRGASPRRDLRLDAETTSALERLARQREVSLNVLVQAAWALLLARYSGEDDVVFGATRACRRGSVEGAEESVGCFINTPPVRVRLDLELALTELLHALRDQQRALRDHEHDSLVEIQAASEVPPRTPLFETILVFDHDRLDSRMRGRGVGFARRSFELTEKTRYALTLYGYAERELHLQLAWDAARFAARSVERMLDHLANLLRAMAGAPDARLGELALLGEAERRRLVVEWSRGEIVEVPRATLAELFRAQARRSPERTALVFEDASLSYAELARRVDALAQRLRARGVGPGCRVGLCVPRCLDLPVAVLGILAAGGAYVPLDPDYPRERLAFMIEDSGLGVLVTAPELLARLPAFAGEVVPVVGPGPDSAAAVAGPDSAAAPEDLAYLIYTSGSTGRPKGVMVEHRNVVNFFVGMDRLLALEEGGTWLAVTSLSFDISVLELLWTLTRGFSVVIQGELHEGAVASPHAGRPMDFSLFYFASGEGAESGDKYRLLLEGARFADRHGFAAVWTPERHFHAFGGLYPNPAVTAAALASITERIQIRAGSVVLPLHHPIRVAEDWALVDNLSAGRVGIAVASGWQPNDFVLAPGNFADAKAVMLRDIDVVRRLWRGEVLEFPGPKGDAVAVRTLPRPVQSELPLWVTAAGNPETWRVAGEIGAGVLTHLLGQSVEELGDKVMAYREARRSAGHAGDGHVALMLHTFVGDDDEGVRERVREPMKEYLGSSVSLIRDMASSIPILRNVPSDSMKEFDEAFKRLAPEDVDAILEHSFERYYETSGLFGTPERCLAMIERLKATGIDEVACLLDFGVEAGAALAQLPLLDEVRRRANAARAAADFAPGPQLSRHGVSHLQCTPSMARLLSPPSSTRSSAARFATCTGPPRPRSGRRATGWRAPRPRFPSAVPSPTSGSTSSTCAASRSRSGFRASCGSRAPASRGATTRAPNSAPNASPRIRLRRLASRKRACTAPGTRCAGVRTATSSSWDGSITR